MNKLKQQRSEAACHLNNCHCEAITECNRRGNPIRHENNEVGITNPPQPSLKKGGSLRAFPRHDNNLFAKQTVTLSPRPLRLCRANRLSIDLREVRVRERGAKTAFTLAEVLITLGIIGVVAAIVMPTLLTNIQDKVQEKRVQNIKQKFSKATDKMLVTSGLNNYGSTAAFVNELQKHLKMAKVCDNSNIAKCWPYETVKLEDGTEWEIAKTKKKRDLKMKNDDSHDWDDTMAFITADGTSYIVSYNKKCDEDESRSVKWSGDQSSSTNCTAMVFDWNGSKKPNTFKKDVIAFNAGGLGTNCTIEIYDKCFSAPFSPTAMTYAECEAEKGKLGINECCTSSYCNSKGDYWAGAVKECGGVSNMPTLADLGEIANLLYEGNPSIDAYDSNYSLTYNGKASQLGLPEPGFSVWSGEEYDSGYAYGRAFGFSYTSWYYIDRDNLISLGLCLVD